MATMSEFPLRSEAQKRSGQNFDHRSSVLVTETVRTQDVRNLMFTDKTGLKQLSKPDPDQMNQWLQHRWFRL